MYNHLENKMCKELEALEEKYRTNAELSEGDLRRMDLLFHSLKSLETYRAMKEADEMRHENTSYSNGSYMNNSYGRDMNRYVSRDQGMSGHYPMNYPPMYPEDRRW